MPSARWPLTVDLPADCSRCNARLHGICEVCGPQALAAMQSYKSANRVVHAGNVLFDMGQSVAEVYNVIDGWGFLYSLQEDGGRQILHFILPGDFIGSWPDVGPESCNAAEALTEMAVCAMPRDSLDALCARHPEVGRRIATMATQGLKLAYARMATIGRADAHRRVAYLLLELYIRQRRQWPDKPGDEMLLPLTQEHIADATGLTPEHVNRTLRALEDENVIAFRRGKLTVLDAQAFRDAAAFDPDLFAAWVEDTN